MMSTASHSMRNLSSGGQGRSVGTYVQITPMEKTHCEAPRIADGIGESYGVYETVSDEDLK